MGKWHHNWECMTIAKWSFFIKISSRWLKMMIIIYGTVIKMHVKIQQVGQWGMLLEHDHEESYEREGQNQRGKKRAIFKLPTLF